MKELIQQLKQAWQRIKAIFDSRAHMEQRLLAALQNEYAEERKIAEILESKSQRVPYEHLRQQLLQIAQEEKKHAEALADQIRALGGTPIEQATNEYDTHDLDLVKLYEEEKTEYVEYLDLAHLAREAGHPEISEVLIKIGEQDREHRQRIMEVLIKLNPLPVG